MDYEEHLLSKYEQPWVLAMHLAGFPGWLLVLMGMWLPAIASAAMVLPVYGLWKLKREESSAFEHQGKQALNFIIYIAGLVCAAQVFAFLMPTLGQWLLFFSVVTHVGFATMAVIKVRETVPYEYPIPRLLRVVK